MPGDRKFDLGDYVEVKDRIKLFYELYANGRLVTGKVYTELGPDGKARVVVKAKAYRTPDDPLPGKGTSWMELPGTTPYTKGSEIENTETSAWGRAIASLGILVDRSIASAQEVQNKQGQAPKGSPDGVHDPGSLVGVIEEAKDSPDFLPHIDPVEGYVLTFKLKGDGRGGGIKVVATGLVAEQLADVGKAAIGMRVSCWGRVKDESFTNKANRTITYQVLELERITGPFGALPDKSPGLDPDGNAVSPLRDPEDTLIAPGQESFDLAASQALDAEEAAKA